MAVKALRDGRNPPLLMRIAERLSYLADSTGGWNRLVKSFSGSFIVEGFLRTLIQSPHALDFVAMQIHRSRCGRCMPQGVHARSLVGGIVLFVKPLHDIFLSRFRRRCAPINVETTGTSKRMRSYKNFCGTASFSEARTSIRYQRVGSNGDFRFGLGWTDSIDGGDTPSSAPVLHAYDGLGF
jgi:hypothetical protein